MALDTKIQTLQAKHPSILVTRNTLACNQIYRGGYAGALEVLHPLLVTCVEKLGTDHLAVFSLEHNVDVAQSGLRNLNCARDSFLAASVGRLKILGPNNILTQRSMANIAYLNSKCSLLHPDERIEIADNALMALEAVHTGYESMTPIHKISALSLDRALAMYNLVKTYERRQEKLKAATLKNQVNQLKTTIRTNNVLHDIVSKPMLDALDKAEDDVILDRRPERIRDIR